MMRRNRYNSIEFVSEINFKSILLFLIGIAGLCFLFYMSRVLWRVRWYSIPNFSSSYLLRTILIGVSVFCIVWSFKTSSIKSSLEFDLSQRIWIWLTVTLSILSALLFFFFPNLSRSLGEEDNIIEWISFLFLIASFFLLIRILLFNRIWERDDPMVAIGLLLLTFLFFFMAMEEISWGQRLFGLTTPEVFDSNSQKEINVHNFFTTEADTIYYIGLCFILVFLPYAKLQNPNVFSLRILKVFIPRPHLIIIGAMPFAFHYNKWNLLFTQIWFFTAVTILVAMVFTKQNRNLRHFFLISVMLIVIIQVAILCGNNSNPVFETGRIAEYKELLSQIGLLAYVADLRYRITIHDSIDVISLKN